jgi:formamidopyrimidine-DNA glycosylase
MPELPEIATRAVQMNAELKGKIISGVEVIQPKCLNVPVEEFSQALAGAELGETTFRGKWLVTETNQGNLLFNLGMGGELLLVTRQSLPEKYRLIFDFNDGSSLAVNFWWFGYAHYARPGELDKHPMLAKIGRNALDVSADDLYTMIKDKRGNLKAFLIDQSGLAGIGNAYAHDILFLARLHPQRQLKSLSRDEVEALAAAIQKGLRMSLDKGGAFYEMDLHGKKGGFLLEDLMVAYRENQPCPVCGTLIQKLKTGSTTTYICPNCQLLEV